MFLLFTPFVLQSSSISEILLSNFACPNKGFAQRVLSLFVWQRRVFSFQKRDLSKSCCLALETPLYFLKLKAKAFTLVDYIKLWPLDVPVFVSAWKNVGVSYYTCFLALKFKVWSF